MSQFTCADCGTTFTVRQQTLDRYPGWSPRQCMACRKGTSPAQSSAPARARGGRGRAGPVEENLTLAAVLAKYTKGPDDGVFTDGSAHPNPGRGGWGAVYVRNGEVVEQRHGSEEHTTNNRMELTALIEGIDMVPDAAPTTIYTDSKLVVDTINKGWARSWERNGWKRKTGPVQNLDLVKELYARVTARPEITLAWIAAHSGNRWNEYADSLSTAHLRDEL